MSADLTFYFDPVCPFAWMTSKWVRLVADQRAYEVDWRFISLRLLNAEVDYPTHFPTGYEAGHTAGLKLLRVAARARATLGPETVGPLYEALGTAIFDREQLPIHPATGDDLRGTPDFVAAVLAGAGLPPELVEALEDTSHDEVIGAETEEALGLTGRDVGTPIIHVDPPHGVAFFGPVISRLPTPEQAVELWEHVVGLARFPGFAELKRSLREVPQLRAYGIEPGAAGALEDWRAGSRRDAD